MATRTTRCAGMKDGGYENGERASVSYASPVGELGERWPADPDPDAAGGGGGARRSVYCGGSSMISSSGGGGMSSSRSVWRMKRAGG